ncbi:MAG: RNase adapter RapZ [Coriobacteriales bacterium]|nr:RNase adapter RapZ [Coriobacteriales bacterium]
MSKKKEKLDESLKIDTNINQRPDLIIITGMSGAGRSEAMHTFEDIGYFCIDNLPPTLISNLVDLAGINSANPNKLAVVCDMRSKNFFSQFFDELEKLKEHGTYYSILFLDAKDEVLLSRFKETRRRHPLCEKGVTILSAIKKERILLEEIREISDFVLDTSAFKPQITRKRIRKLFADEDNFSSLDVSIYSFGFKHGAAIDADIVIDVRFLPNPYYVPDLRDKTGLTKEVKDFVLKRKETKEFLKSWKGLLDVIMPGYVEEGKQYLTIAVGCTGGQHRSVVLAEATSLYLSQQGYKVDISHRDLDLAESGND